jgi:hypothetical protein
VSMHRLCKCITSRCENRGPRAAVGWNVTAIAFHWSGVIRPLKHFDWSRQVQFPQATVGNAEQVVPQASTVAITGRNRCTSGVDEMPLPSTRTASFARPACPTTLPHAQADLSDGTYTVHAEANNVALSTAAADGMSLWPMQLARSPTLESQRPIGDSTFGDLWPTTHPTARTLPFTPATVGPPPGQLSSAGLDIAAGSAGTAGGGDEALKGAEEFFEGKVSLRHRADHSEVMHMVAGCAARSP